MVPFHREPLEWDRQTLYARHRPGTNHLGGVLINFVLHCTAGYGMVQAWVAKKLVNVTFYEFL